MSAKRIALVIALVSGILTLLSCSFGPPEPSMGSPAFYWQGARETYRAGDYMKTVQNLDNLLATENEFTPRALPWILVLKSGIAQGYMDAADSYAEGVRSGKGDSLTFHRQINANRTSASQLALQFGEDYGRLAKLQGDSIALEFAYPKGTAAPVAQFTKVAAGIALTPTEADAAQQAAIVRGVLLSTCRAAGAADDTAKAEDVLKTGTASVTRATFMLAMADNLYRFSQLYAPDKLDEPQKLGALLERAQAAMTGLPETNETKELNHNIEGALKKAKARQ